MNKYLAHFSDVNLGAIRDRVTSVHLSSNLTNSLYKGVLNQYPLEMSNAEKEHHSSALIEYAAYANSVGKSDFFYWLTLCPRSPEISLTSSDDAVQVGKNEGNLISPSPETSSCAVKCDLYDVKGNLFSNQDITYLQALKDIKAQIEFLNKCAFDKSILTSDEHFALLGIEEELKQLIHFDPIRPADDGLPLRYDHFNCFSLPDNLE